MSPRARFQRIHALCTHCGAMFCFRSISENTKDSDRVKKMFNSVVHQLAHHVEYHDRSVHHSDVGDNLALLPEQHGAQNQTGRLRQPLSCS